jgi:Mor family transcriptional regulator
MPRQFLPARELAVEYVKNNPLATYAEVASKYNVTFWTVYRWTKAASVTKLHRRHIVTKPKRKKRQRNTERDEKIFQDRQNGLTLAAIGVKYGITRQRVFSILTNKPI